jgi:Cdc6-like AAA superfamily ATPase
MTDIEKSTLRTHLSAMFRPSAPIDKYGLFAGRQQQTDMLISAILQTGQHAVLYGERGIGKTSLARVLAEILPAAGSRAIHSDTINCDSTDDFSSLWHRALRELTFKIAAGASYKIGRPNTYAVAKEEEKESSGLVPKTVTPDDVRRALSTFTGTSAVIVFDEFDRITNKEVKTLMADTIKNLSDHAIDTTLLIVGVARSVVDLISEHRSIDRAIVEVPMPRMSPEELGQIIRKGFANMKVVMSDSVNQKIIILSHGLPHYTHLLSLESGRAAIDRGSYAIEDADLLSALDQVVKSKHSVAGEYRAAVRSAHKASKHKMTLLACALTKTDVQGYFQSSDVAATMAVLLGEGSPVPDVQKHLAEFATMKRGNVLEREGSLRQFRYRFSNSLLQPYTIISSLSEKLITDQKVWDLK